MPGIVQILHTFGGVLNFHPHIHMLLTAGGLAGEEWQKCTFFPYDVLKSRFRAILVRMLRAWVKEQVLALPGSVIRLWKRKKGVETFGDLLRTLFSVTWYVHVGERLANATYTIGYIGRYAKRPCISEAKITFYDGETVSFEYKDKVTREHTTLELPVMEFIARLIRHIPEKGFHMVRYGGLNANRSTLHEIAKKAVERLYCLQPLRSRLLLTWRERVKRRTGVDPLVCPHCLKEMRCVERAYRARDGTLRVQTFA